MPHDTGLFKDLRAYHLLEPAELEELTSDPRLGSGSPEQVVAELQSRGWLTEFQAEKILQGSASDLVLDTHYVLLDVLGEGGMGTVYKARHLTLHQIRAIKTIRPEHTMNEGAVKRFYREMEMSARLNHPNIVLAFDAGEAQGMHYIAMEYVEGQDLSGIIKAQGPMAVGLAADYVRQAALGLQHAHEQGMVHRDIKPSNLLVTGDGSTVKILDLGLARLHSSEPHEATLTHTGTIMGTPDYIAPEQTEDSKHVDVRADIYSLGCSFYEMLTGQVPYPGGSLLSKLRRHAEKAPDPVQDYRSDVPQ